MTDDPDTFQCSLCGEWRDVGERHVDTTDYGPGDWCDDCTAKPWR